MLRYVAIGAVAGFLLSVLLLSRRDQPPPAPPAAVPTAPSLVEAPAVLRRRAIEPLPGQGIRHEATVLSGHHLDTVAPGAPDAG